MTETNQHQDVKDAVHAAVKSGDDVHQQVKDITLKALTKATTGCRKYQKCDRSSR